MNQPAVQGQPKQLRAIEKKTLPIASPPPALRHPLPRAAGRSPAAARRHRLPRWRHSRPRPLPAPTPAGLRRKRRQGGGGVLGGRRRGEGRRGRRHGCRARSEQRNAGGGAA
uniref:Uncharacterized protein n=1 Tax=Triticum urartu TaxID=4572 RepID=A0A8R7QPQ1_TRIUA